MEEPRIIHEDEAILVIDKPSGMPSASLKEGERGTVSAWIVERFPDQAGVGPDPREAGLANRLDNETSGVLIAARTDEAYESLREQFRTGRMRKRYLALVIGSPPDRGVVDAPIAHHPRKRSRMLACESEDRARELKARPAHTSFMTLNRFRLGGASYALIEVMIKSGSRHQIRVHLAHIGHPISGDKLYRNPKKRASDPLDPPRHLLHSAKVSLVHTASGETMTFEANPPADFGRQLGRLEAV